MNRYYDEILFLPMPNYKILALFFYQNSLTDCHILTKDYFYSITDHLSEEYGNVRLLYDPDFEFWGGKDLVNKV